MTDGWPRRTPAAAGHVATARLRGGAVAHASCGTRRIGLIAAFIASALAAAERPTAVDADLDAPSFRIDVRALLPALVPAFLTTLRLLRALRYTAAR